MIVIKYFVFSLLWQREAKRSPYWKGNGGVGDVCGYLLNGNYLLLDVSLCIRPFLLNIKQNNRDKTNFLTGSLSFHMPHCLNQLWFRPFINNIHMQFLWNELDHILIFHFLFKTSMIEVHTKYLFCVQKFLFFFTFFFFFSLPSSQHPPPLPFSSPTPTTRWYPVISNRLLEYVPRIKVS